MTARNHLISREEPYPGVLQRIANDDKTAFEDCIKSYKGLIWTIARKYSADYEDAEHIAQEIFISIWMNAYRFDAHKAPESAFISLLAHRKAIDVLRKRKMQFAEMDENHPEKNNDRNILLGLDLRTIKRALKIFLRWKTRR